MSPSINRNFILGRDWLVQNGVRLYFDLGFLRVGKTTVPLEEDIHIASPLRLGSTTVLKPQTATVCLGKIKESSDIPIHQIYSVTAVETNVLSKEPGLMVSNSVAKLNGNRSLPIMIVNNTNRTVRLSKDCIIAKVDKTNQGHINSLDSVNRHTSQADVWDWTTEVDVPKDHRSTVVSFLKKHHDIKDSELGHTDTVKMKLDTGDHLPIKLRPYRTPIHNLEVIDKAVDEMLEANVVSHS